MPKDIKALNSRFPIVQAPSECCNLIKVVSGINARINHNHRWTIPTGFKVKQREVLTMKTYEQWSASKLSLSQFLKIGDKVDNVIMNYFIEVLPPIMGAGFLQMGEPYTFNASGQYTYLTLEHIHGDWFYTGDKPDLRKELNK